MILYIKYLYDKYCYGLDVKTFKEYVDNNGYNKR